MIVIEILNMCDFFFFSRIPLSRNLSKEIIIQICKNDWRMVVTLAWFIV